ncbi:MAG: N-6 DNA methylase, partial [Planctomycetes bacterium]|nr:N-6 DNA methylase [Planctomycetota bacterium]
MKNQNALMLKHTEAAFSTCLSYLIEKQGLDPYQDDTARLSADTRRLAVYLISQRQFKDVTLPSIPEWETMVSVAGQLTKTELANLTNSFPPLEGSTETSPSNPAATHTLSEIGFFYERLKEFQIRMKEGKPEVVSAHLKRKRSGTYFTPLSVCNFMVEQTLKPLLEEAKGRAERILQARIIDPAMGTGQFLLAVLERLVKACEPATEAETLALRRDLCTHSIYGIDLDGENVEVARFLLGLYTQGGVDTGQSLVQGDALIDSDKDALEFGGEGFPEKIFTQRKEPFDGFDAIVGNPPYLSAKVQTFSKYKHYLTGATQADFYLLFIQKYAARKYLRPGGGLCFIVPDPLLLRANAESARLRLLEGLDLEFLLHIKGVFPRTSVANVVFLARRNFQKSETVEVARIEKPSQVRAFRRQGAGMLKMMTRRIPLQYFRDAPRKEFRYFLDEPANDVLKKLDTTRPTRPGARIVVRSLQTLAGNKAAIFRGEEIGKERVKKLT